MDRTLLPGIMTALRKSTWATKMQAELATFPTEHNFYLNNKLYLSLIWGFGIHFLKKKKKKSDISKKQQYLLSMMNSSLKSK